MHLNIKVGNQKVVHIVLVVYFSFSSRNQRILNYNLWVNSLTAMMMIEVIPFSEKCFFKTLFGETFADT